MPRLTQYVTIVGEGTIVASPTLSLLLVSEGIPFREESEAPQPSTLLLPASSAPKATELIPDTALRVISKAR